MREYVNFVTKLKFFSLSFLIISVSLTACSMDEFTALLITPTSAPTITTTPTEALTPTPSATITSTPTITITPTFIELDGSSEAEFAVPTFAIIPTATPFLRAINVAEQGSLIASISVSDRTLYWGNCEGRPEYVDFKVGLAGNRRVTYVLLFLRLVDKGGNQSTAWGGGAIMNRRSGGEYTYRIRPENISHYDEFKNAWVQYQVVAATSSLRTLGRSQVYRDYFSLEYCEPVEEEQ